MNRMTVLYFALSGLDLLEALELEEAERRQIISWIYSLQILPTEDKGKGRKHCNILTAQQESEWDGGMDEQNEYWWRVLESSIFVVAMLRSSASGNNSDIFLQWTRQQQGNIIV